MPFGHSAIGVRSVSWVGVIAAFASQRIGPRPRMSEEHEHQDVQAAEPEADAPVAASPPSDTRPRSWSLACRTGRARSATARVHQLAHDRVSRK